MISWSKGMNFIPIHNPITNFNEQKYIDPQQVQQFFEAALYYDFDIPVVVRFLGSNDTRKYRDTVVTLNEIRDTHYGKVAINDVKRTLEIGCPNKMIADSSHQNFLKFFRYWNYTSLENSLDKVIKTESDIFSLFPTWLVKFISESSSNTIRSTFQAG